MGVGKVVGGVVKLGIAAVAVAGVCSFFKDEIRETEAYKKANDKYDVDTKVQKASEKVKSTVKETAKTVSETAKTVKGKFAPVDDQSVAEDEIILDENADASERDYVALDNASEAVAEAAAPVVAAAEEAAPAVEAAAENIVLD